MFYKIKNYIIYKKNWHIVKKELAKISVNILPMISEYSKKKSELIQFVLKLADSTQNIEKEQLLHMVLTILADKLAADQTRLVEILQYISTLSPDDIRKILIHAAAETISNNQA